MREKIKLVLFLTCLFAFSGCSYEEEFSAYEEIDELANKYFEEYIGEGEYSTSLGAHDYTADMNIDIYYIRIDSPEITYKQIYGFISAMEENMPSYEHTANGITYEINDKYYDISGPMLTEDEVVVYPL
ncbi:hypothetical protein [Faecalicoccus pleomorphus]|uniref:hypothetical protein n=1 Tax=Faecalicoccus pleomorphus TaxID=1323 RepID=UPI001960D0BC|nr:hypothetical protein [Faecalicoccus pleomorphus]MBM6807513.1 hypothetical protein [Faecalicoccus pleomorphus]